MNALFICYRKKISLREIGVETIYINDNAGSHFNPLRDSYRIYKEILRFSASSIISFFLDYGIYSLLLWLTAGFSKSISLFLSNVMARILSGCFNYQVKRNLVFQEKTDAGRTAVRVYFVSNRNFGRKYDSSGSSRTSRHEPVHRKTMYGTDIFRHKLI